MLKMMQFVFPIVVQIQMDVIKNYGFSEGREGIGFKCISISVIKINYNAVFIIIYSFFLSVGTVQFVQLLRALEREDPEIAQLHSQVRSYFLPPVTISSSTEASL